MTPTLKTELLQLLQRPDHGMVEAKKRQSEIGNQLLRGSESIDSPNFRTVSTADLGFLFQLNDEVFFRGLLGRLCEQVARKPLAFRLSTRMTNSGGMTTMHRLGGTKTGQLEFEIAIATTPLFSSFRDSQPIPVGGRPCRNRMEALQRIMEHEMIHLTEMLLWNDSNCSARRFKRLVRDFFGHSESNHQLLTPRDLAKKKLGISPGDKVTFSMQGRELQGHVNAITKRATVLVKSRTGTLYDDGFRYEKYYVPLQRLRRA